MIPPNDLKKVLGYDEKLTKRSMEIRMHLIIKSPMGCILSCLFYRCFSVCAFNLSYKYVSRICLCRRGTVCNEQSRVSEKTIKMRFTNTTRLKELAKAKLAHDMKIRYDHHTTRTQRIR